MNTAKDDGGAKRDASRPNYLVPGAILVGFAMLSVAIYFGLQARGGGTGAPSAAPSAPDLSLPQDEPQAWIATEAPSSSAETGEGGGAPAAAPEARPPSEVHHRGAFETRWLPQRAEAEKTCNPLAYLKPEPSIWFVEIPLELAIDKQGHIRKVRRFAKLRAVRDSGAYESVDMNPPAQEQLVRCYADQLAKRVRFDPATENGTLEAWVRIIDTTVAP